MNTYAYSIDDLETTLQSNFQAGVDSVYNAVKAKGSTPSSKSLSDVVTAIGNISTGTQLIYLGTGNSFNVSNYSGYKNFTVNNFVINPTSGGRSSGTLGNGAGGPIHADANFSKSYNASTGAFSVTLSATAIAFTSNITKAFSKKVYLAPGGLPG